MTTHPKHAFDDVYLPAQTLPAVLLRGKNRLPAATHTDAMHIRMPKRLAVFIKTLALIEGSDSSKIARRFLTISAVQEGYDPDGV